MSAEVAVPAARPPTGGPSLTRFERKRWWQQLADRLEQALETVAAEDALDRKPAAVVVGSDEVTWQAWLGTRGASTGVPRVGLAVAIDALDDLAVPDARALVADLHRRVVPGGRLLLVERVVRRPGHPVRGIHDLLTIVSGATGGAVVLADIASVARPGEPHPSTVMLELLRLALPEDA